MTRNPILKVLSTLCAGKVQFLLMGGQACVFYGAAEFSRDTDIVILADPVNLDKLSETLRHLEAECIAVPAFSLDNLQLGHAVHFRCQHPDALGMRIDVMSKLRGVAPFPELWKRRTMIEVESGHKFDLMSLPDLVNAKKTQRDKDWPMIRRLVEANYFENNSHPTPEQITFWFKESRTADMLIELARKYPEKISALEKERHLLKFATEAKEEALAEALDQEEKRERQKDRIYWDPLIKELEQMRHHEG